MSFLNIKESVEEETRFRRMFVRVTKFGDSGELKAGMAVKAEKRRSVSGTSATERKERARLSKILRSWNTIFSACAASERVDGFFTLTLSEPTQNVALVRKRIQEWLKLLEPGLSVAWILDFHEQGGIHVHGVVVSEERAPIARAMKAWRWGFATFRYWKDKNAAQRAVSESKSVGYMRGITTNWNKPLPNLRDCNRSELRRRKNPTVRPIELFASRQLPYGLTGSFKEALKSVTHTKFSLPLAYGTNILDKTFLHLKEQGINPSEVTGWIKVESGQASMLRSRLSRPNKRVVGWLNRKHRKPFMDIRAMHLLSTPRSN
jgi:hypothetical protein